jgi:uncharacterized membrane protein
VGLLVRLFVNGKGLSSLSQCSDLKGALMWGFDLPIYFSAYKTIITSNDGAILIGLLLILIIVLLAGQKRRRSSKVQIGGKFPNGDDPLDIIATRFAKGEIAQDEYYRMKHTLKNHLKTSYL